MLAIRSAATMRNHRLVREFFFVIQCPIPLRQLKHLSAHCLHRCAGIHRQRARVAPSVMRCWLARVIQAL